MYVIEQTKVIQTANAQTPTRAESSFGVLQINSNVFSNSKYSPDTVIVSGSVTSITRGTPITLHIIKPDNTSEERGIVVTKTGEFTTPLTLSEKWPSGNYSIIAMYGSNEVGTVYFQVVSDKTKTSVQQSQSSTATQYLKYIDNQFGFSLNYPSYIEKQELRGKDDYYPNMINLVSFNTSSELTFVNVGIIHDDNIYRGLNGQKFLDRMKTEFNNALCSSIESGQDCSLEAILNEEFTHRNGYSGYRSAYILTISDPSTTIKALIGATMIPDGNDIWMIVAGSFSNDEIKTIGKDIDEITSSLTISDYSAHKQFLQTKTIQQKDIVYLVIRNPDNSSTNIYGIKLTNTNGNITNFINVKGWNPERVGPDSIFYKTSTPLSSSEIFKVALKVDSTDTTLKWEAFSKDQKILSTGIVNSQ